MNDACLICEWMEPKPSDAQADRVTDWWMFGSVDTGWIPRPLTLDALWEVEERLISLGLADVYRLALVRQDEYFWHATFWHATAEQKIKALADVIRSGKNSTSDTPSFPPPNTGEPQ